MRAGIAVAFGPRSPELGEVPLIAVLESSAPPVRPQAVAAAAVPISHRNWRRSHPEEFFIIMINIDCVLCPHKSSHDAE